MDAASTITTLSVAPRQTDRMLRLSTAFGRDALVAEALEGFEAVGRGGFRLSVTALATDAFLDLDAPLGDTVLVELLTAESRVALRSFHGHVTAFERVGANGGLARYRLVIEPWLVFLGHRHDSFIIQDMSVVEIAESLFADWQ